MSNEYYLEQIKKLTSNGFETFKILNEILNWEFQYEFIENNKGKFWWKTKESIPSKSGELFKDFADAKLNAMIHFCNCNPFTRKNGGD